MNGRDREVIGEGFTVEVIEGEFTADGLVGGGHKDMESLALPLVEVCLKEGAFFIFLGGVVLGEVFFG